MPSEIPHQRFEARLSDGKTADAQDVMVELTEVAIHEGSDLEGSRAGTIGPDHSVVVVAVRPLGAREFVNPARHAGALEGGDVIIVLGDRESVEELRRHAH